MATGRVLNTKNYRMFERHSDENRPLNIGTHKKLMESMKQYGFLSSYPISVIRNGHEKFTVKDGQHRLMIAETLGLPVYFIEEAVDYDVAIVNSAAKGWALRDYAQKWAANGNKDYQSALEFAERYGVPLTIAFTLLSGIANFSHIGGAFVSGTWKIKDEKYANDVAALYMKLSSMDSRIKNKRFVEACMAICRVKDFSHNRLVTNAERCREKLASYSTRDAYLDMLEAIYNFGRHQLVGLKAAALMAMRDRNPAKKIKPEEN